LLTAVRGRIGPYGNIVFHIAVAKEFAGHLDEAAKLFAGFRYVPQAGSYIQQAWYHLEMMARLRAAEAARAREERANRFYVLAVNYWEVGFRGQALRTLDRAIEADPTFYPAIIFSSIFRHRAGDAVAARRFLEQARSFAPTNVLTLSLGDILLIGDSLGTARDAKRIIALRQRRALAMITMGLRDDAVDDLRAVIALDPTNREALRRLGDLYYHKQHQAPALAVFSTLEGLGGLDQEGKARLAELRKRWE
jgi:tetratricopeptide (TPR) repeat protein